MAVKTATSPRYQHLCKELEMSNVPPDQPSPFATDPTHEMPPTNSAKQKGSRSALTVILIVCAVGFVCLLACGGLLIALLLPALCQARLAARNMSRSHYLKMVGLAMHNYHSTHKTLPATVIVNGDGEETSGWRIAVAPFLPDSVVMGETMLPVKAPKEYNGMLGLPSDTCIFAIVAPNSFFSPTPNTPLRFRDATDGIANTFLAISLPNRNADWRSNVNMTPDEAYQAIQELTPNEFAFVLLGDGEVKAVKAGDKLDRAMFDAWVSRDGGEYLERPQNTGYPRWSD